MNLVFDFAGVVFHWQPLATLRATIPQQAHDEPSSEHWFREIFTGWAGDWGEFDRGRLEAETLVARIAARTGLADTAVRAVVDAVPRALRPDPPTVAWLDALRHAGHRLFFLSNMPEPYARHLEATQPLGRWFEQGVFSARVDAIKPEPAIFAIAERQFGLVGAELIFLDDVAANVQSAQQAGWRALHYRDATQAQAAVAALAALRR